MPLLDHFRPPLHPRRHWESFHSGWATALAAALNDDLLPEGYFAEEHIHIGPRIEIDVTTFAEPPATEPSGGAPAAVRQATWTAPAVDAVIPAAFPDTFTVQVFDSEGGARLVAAIELVSPANKDRDSHRRAFASKCAGYLAQGVSLVIIDIVTTRHYNLHDEMMAVIGQPTIPWAGPTWLYATAYRPIVRDGRQEIDMWARPLALGQGLPTLPLALNAEIVLPLDLEATYAENCSRRRLPG